MKLAIISFARDGSKRLPKKNTMLLNGKPLIWYTLQTMKYLYKNCLLYNDFYLDGQRYDSICTFLIQGKELEKYCYDNDYPYIVRDHPIGWDDNRLNQWSHEKLDAQAYLLLQPTSPFRNNEQILKWLNLCIYENNIQSAFSVTKQDDLTFKRNGLFFYYTKEQLKTGKLVDENSLIFQGFDIDIDTMEDFKKAEEYAKQNNYGVLL